MPIESIISQPVANSINAAYRPVVIRVAATRTDADPRPPVVYCDVYFNDVFYKTLPKSQYIQLNDNDSEWQFDIQDAAQEYLQKYLAANGDAAIKEATLVVSKALCKFRSSGYDTDGFITPEGTPPVQGTGDNDPVSGTGTSSNIFYVVNATLQHEDEQNLSSHLNSIKKRTWGSKTFPLSHRPDYYRVCVGDSDSFMIVHGSNKELSCLRLKYRNIGQNTYFSSTNCNVFACPLLTNLDYIVVDNGDDTQTFTFTFDDLEAPAALLTIQYRLHGSGSAWTDASGSADSPRTIDLPLGIYDFRFASTGSCVAQPGNEIIGIGTAGEVCEPVEIVGTPSLPDAARDIAYNYSFLLSGTAPFTLVNVVKPDWMTIEITGNTVSFSGVPDIVDVADDVQVGFDIVNCGGGGSMSGSGSSSGSDASFDDVIDVLDTGGCTPVTTDPDPIDLPEATAGVNYAYIVDLLGSAPFSLSNLVKPGWMVVELSGNAIIFSGIPGPGDIADDVVFSVDVSNCGGANTISLNDTLDVVEGLKYYLAEKIDCSGCTVAESDVLVSLPSSHLSPVPGKYYRPAAHPTGFVYVVDNLEQAPGAATALSTDHFSSCGGACS